MNVTLISFDQELYCLGIRILSTCLRKAGHRVKCVFLPPMATTDSNGHKFQARYSANLLSAIRSSCSDSDLIGMSLMTNQFIPAVSVTQYLKKHQITAPIVWGGIQPTVEPGVCLEYADVVCLGEGEDALLELVDQIQHGRNYFETRNMWFKSQDKIIRNPMRPLEQDLDKIPLPDYSCNNHFIAKGDCVEELTVERLVRFRGERFYAQGKAIPYPLVTSRGCPFSCSYCCNSVYASLYPKEKRLRWRSVDNVISELQMIRREVAPLSSVCIVDDNFTARSKSDIEAFCKRYQAEIGIPFACQVSPLTVNKEKLDILTNSGCVKVTMGVETNSDRIAAMYNRSHFHKVDKIAIALLEKYRLNMKLPPTYQFIIDNPYETIDETIQTLKLALSLKKPWDNPIYSLMFFPGTPLYEKALFDGFIKDKYGQIYGKNWLEQSKAFFQFWIRLYRLNCPVFLLQILLHPWIVRLMTNNLVNAIWKMRIFRWLWNKPK